LIDPILSGHDAASKIVMRVLRYGAVAPSCIVLFIYSLFNPEEKKIQIGISITVTLFYINWIVGGFFSQLHFMGLVFGHLSAFFMMKLSFKYASIAGVFFQIVFIVSAGVVGFGSLLGVFMTLTGVFMYGILSSYQFEKYLRMTFVNEKLLDMEKERLKIEQAKSEELLVNLLPASIAHSLKSGEQTIANKFSNITIMFVHIVGLSSLQQDLELKELFKLVNQIFCKYDDLTDIYRIEKIKTIGSSYMLASGLENFNMDGREILKGQNKKMIDIAIEMLQYIQDFTEDSKRKSRNNVLFDLSSVPNLNIRVGIHMGPIVAGVIGKKKFTYDVWGDVVNVASRMESTGIPGQIQVTEKVYEIMKDDYKFEERGEIEVKGKGKMKTYFMLSRKGQTTVALPTGFKDLNNGGHH
jgi:class 3 adenylate cyclase